MFKFIIPASISIFMLTTVASADIQVKFDEGAPKDRFTISNLSGCTIDKGDFVIDLSKSTAGLIFDTTNQGAGVEVFQPFEITSGSAFLSNLPRVSDGDNQVKLSFVDFRKGEKISFTVDVDDTIGQREITVSGSEISGAGVSLVTDAGAREAKFTNLAVAQINMDNCTSS